MPEYALDRALLAIRADSGADLDAEVTTLAGGWVDISDGNKGRVSIAGSASNTRLTPFGRNTMGRMVGGDRAGTLTFATIRQNIADPGMKLVEDAFLAAPKARIHVLVQPNKDVLTSEAGVVTPAATEANPQYVGSVMLNSWDFWGPGGNDNTAILTAVGDLDSDFRRLPA